MSNSGNVIINFFLSNHFEVNVKELFFEKSSVHLFFFFFTKNWVKNSSVKRT